MDSLDLAASPLCDLQRKLEHHVSIFQVPDPFSDWPHICTYIKNVVFLLYDFCLNFAFTFRRRSCCWKGQTLSVKCPCPSPKSVVQDFECFSQFFSANPLVLRFPPSFFWLLSCLLALIERLSVRCQCAKQNYGKWYWKTLPALVVNGYYNSVLEWNGLEEVENAVVFSGFRCGNI